MIGVAIPTIDRGGLVDTDLDTLATALYVKIDDELKMRPELGRARPEVGLCPKLSDAELITLAVIQALLGFTSKTRFLRHAAAVTGNFDRQPFGSFARAWNGSLR